MSGRQANRFLSLTRPPGVLSLIDCVAFLLLWLPVVEVHQLTLPADAAQFAGRTPGRFSGKHNKKQRDTI